MIRQGVHVVSGVPSGEAQGETIELCLLRDVLTPMRDGTLLAMDVLRPAAAGRYPVILSRTPYNKGATLSSVEGRPFLERLACRGYAVAIQDCRGRYNSDGAFDPYRHEEADGIDTIDWLAQQEWCDGNVGMLGGSYVGQTQWFAAAGAPKALKAIVPTSSPPGHPFLNEPFWGGVFLLAMAEWMVTLGRRCDPGTSPYDLFTEEKSYFNSLPLCRLAEASGTSSPWWKEWLSHPTYDDYWRARSYEHSWGNITVPALNITGWWDMNFPGAPRNFVGMRKQGATPRSRQGQRLVIGPWPHWVNRVQTLNGIDFGTNAVTDLRGYIIRFFDHWLRGHGDSLFNEGAAVHVFVIGANEWWEADEWPLPGTTPTNFYLHSDGQANTHNGNGQLSMRAPGNEPWDEYESDPLKPVSSLWNLQEGPVDDRPVTRRSDVVCYTSEVLTEALDVVGPIMAVLYASSSARDCDWHVRVVDVHPDDTARFLSHGVLRSRFRSGFEEARFLQPGEIERFEIDVGAAGVRFLPGHRIRIEITSSWFSRFECNPQTDAQNWMTDERRPKVARQRIHHSSSHASFVSLPVISQRPT